MYLSHLLSIIQHMTTDRQYECEKCGDTFSGHRADRYGRWVNIPGGQRWLCVNCLPADAPPTIDQRAHEITGDRIVPGNIIGLRDRSIIGRHADQFLVVFVLAIYDIGNDERYVHGYAVTADDVLVMEPIIVAVNLLEPVDLYGTMPVTDWSADHARRMALVHTGEVNT